MNSADPVVIDMYGRMMIALEILESCPEFAAWLKAYCEKRNWTFSMIDRSREPVEVQQAECGSMPWKVGEAVRAAGGRVPKICYENGAVGKEPVSVITGSDPITVAEELTAIAREYIREKGPQWVR